MDIKARSHILVCAGAGCVASGSLEVSAALQSALEAKGLDKEVQVIETGCLGPCAAGPVAVVYPDGVFYQNLKPEDAAVIVEEHILKGRIVERLVHKEHATSQAVPALNQIDFFKGQERIVLRNCGVIDPLKIDDYIARDGYQALAKVLTEMTPEQVTDTVKKSGLRGRGGAGFPTGLKWEFTRKAQGERKYVLCNADEGDPGAFMDRDMLESDPFAVIEGITLGGFAIGAHQGFFYIRAEYPMAIKRVQTAINLARKAGLLGENILGSAFSFDLEIRLGAGAFVCGEETSLINSIQGERGEPRIRPPYPTQEGLWGHPTVINNVETLANVPAVLFYGADWFRQIGTAKSGGTKVFALAGKVRHTGLVEVPMGSTLREIIFNIGGGVPGNKQLKAVQTGGPAGGCIPADAIDTVVDYETLTKAGSIMGSGGMIVMDEDDCMVDIARYYIGFNQDESCGKCTPCREGTMRMLEIFDRIVGGEGTLEDLNLLERLGNLLKKAALCGLGRAAPNPVLSTLKNFRKEYEAHVIDKVCPTGKCPGLKSGKSNP